MMNHVIFMAGMPFTGKTYVVNRLARSLDMIVISPKFFRPDDYNKMTRDDKTNIDINAWYCSLEQLGMAIDKYGDQIVVFDTSCASLDAMQPYFNKAKFRHTVLYILVNAPLKICKERAGSKWIPEDVLISYKNNFNQSIPVLSKLAHKYFIINNIDKPDISQVIKFINKYEEFK